STGAASRPLHRLEASVVVSGQPRRCSVVTAVTTPVRPGAEELLGVPDPVRQGVYLVVGVVHVEGGPGAGLHAQRPVQRPGAVVPGAHRDAELVEYLPHAVRVDAVDLESHRAAAVLGGMRPQN